MQLVAPHQTPGNIGRLQRRALGRRMRREIAGDHDEDAPAFIRVALASAAPSARANRAQNQQKHDCSDRAIDGQTHDASNGLTKPDPVDDVIRCLLPIRGR
jgi:hypothetical protein